MADSLEGCGVSVAHVTNYITKLRSLAKVYDKVRLSGPYTSLLDLPPSPSYPPDTPAAEIPSLPLIQTIWSCSKPFPGCMP